MRMLVIVVATACLSLVVGRPAIAQSTYTISVPADESTLGDLGMLASAVLATADGDASQPIRKLGAGVVGELRILMNQRIAGDALTLDDGSTAALVDGDTILVAEKCDPTTTECSGDAHGAEIQWSKDGHGPSSIFIKTGNGCSRVIQFATAGRPRIVTKCPVK